MKAKANRMEQKMEYALDLIETTSVGKKEPLTVVADALAILDFGQINPKEFLNYLNAVGR